MFKQLLLVLALIRSDLYDEIPGIKKSIEKLHKIAKRSTYYELFGVPENATMRKLRSRYTAMLKDKKSLPHLSREDANRIIIEGYNILKSKRKAYDFLLGNSKFLFVSEKNYKTTRVIFVLAILCALVFADMLVYTIRYLVYFTAPVEAVDSQKKKEKKKKTYLYTKKAPRMLSVMLISWVRSKF